MPNNWFPETLEIDKIFKADAYLESFVAFIGTCETRLWYLSQ